MQRKADSKPQRGTKTRTVWSTRVLIVFTVLLLTLAAAIPSPGFSVLAHEAIIDVVWDPAIRPLLLARYPKTTTEELQEARSYAYGGSLIQDMGYYPFGSHFFTDLLHYVRSGDFIETMLRDAQDPNEYAFALGAASHFFADTTGHSLGINRSVPMRYPKLRSKFGDEVTYAEAKKEHLLVEFSFDVTQVAQGTYAPQAYHDFIGFRVSKPLLERAFHEVYGLEMKDVFADEDLALGTYRRTVSTLIPRMTRVAWSQKHDEIAKLTPGMERRKFIVNVSRQEYDKEFGKQYRQPGIASRFLGFIFTVIPKIGPLKSLSFKPPTPQMQALFEQSFEEPGKQYGEFLARVSTGVVPVANRDFDTGRATVRGEYVLADKAYAQLVDKLASRKFVDTPRPLAASILRFYATPVDDRQMSKKERKEWEKTERELSVLRMSVGSQTLTSSQ